MAPSLEDCPSEHPSRVSTGIARRLAKFNAPRQKTLPSFEVDEQRSTGSTTHRVGRVRVQLPAPTITQIHEVFRTADLDKVSSCEASPPHAPKPRVAAVWPSSVRVLHHSLVQAAQDDFEEVETGEEDVDLALTDPATSIIVHYALLREEEVVSWSGVPRKLPIGTGDGQDDDEGTSPEDFYKGCLHYAGVMEAAVARAAKDIAAAKALECDAFPRPEDWDS